MFIILIEEDAFRDLFVNFNCPVPAMKGLFPNASPSPPLHFNDMTAKDVKAAAQLVRHNIIMVRAVWIWYQSGICSSVLEIVSWTMVGAAMVNEIELCSARFNPAINNLNTE
jgi:hypothetical protein